MQQFLRPPGQRVATAQPLAALPLTDAACPLRASGTRGRRNQWNTGDGNTGSAAARDSKREAGQMRSCTPTNHRTRAAGICHQACTAPRRARRTVPVNPQAPSHADPRRARRATAPERVKAPFSLTPGAAHSLFGQDQKENGGRIPHGQCPLAGARPLRPPFGGPPSLGWQKSIPWISLFFK